MQDVETLINRGIRSLSSLAPALRGLQTSAPEPGDLEQAIARGHFRPDEEERLQAWFARYLTARGGLLEMIADLSPAATGSAACSDESQRLRCFLIAYAAACLLVRSAALLVRDVATHTLVQRKLNEPVPRLRVPRKQYTAVYRSLTSPMNAWRLSRSMDFADANRREIDALAHDPSFAPVVAAIAESEESLRVGVRRYLKRRLRYRLHAWRRRRASATEQSFFGIVEAFGRVTAEMRPHWRQNRVTPRVRADLEALLRPGDVVVTRREYAMTNLFLPGYWPHAALHIGPASTHETLPITMTADQRRRWADPIRVLEAQKDGVRLRPLSETLSVDAVVIIRPLLSDEDLADALGRALTHEGKLYNFDCNFFTADRLVCTEVAYRAYDGVGPIKFELKRRAGRLTLAAEDLLDLALDRNGFELVAVFGAPACAHEIVTGARAADVLARSYRG